MGQLTHLCARLFLQVIETMTTWEGGVEAADVPVTEEGVQVQDATETDPPVVERRTSGNRLKVAPLPSFLFNSLRRHTVV